MDVNPITRSLNLPPSPAVPSNTPAAEKVRQNTAETAKVTAPPATGDAASHGGTSGNRGLGNHVNFYDTRPAKVAAEKNAQSTTQSKAPALNEKTEEVMPVKKMHILGKGTG